MCQLTDWVLQDDEIDFSSLNEWSRCYLAKIRRLACPCLHCRLQLSDVVVADEFKQIILNLVSQHAPRTSPVVQEKILPIDCRYRLAAHSSKHSMGELQAAWQLTLRQKPTLPDGIPILFLYRIANQEQCVVQTACLFPGSCNMSLVFHYCAFDQRSIYANWQTALLLSDELRRDWIDFETKQIAIVPWMPPMSLLRHYLAWFPRHCPECGRGTFGPLLLDKCGPWSLWQGKLQGTSRYLQRPQTWYSFEGFLLV